MIPRLIFRSVPEHTTEQVEQFWAGARHLHPGWETISYRDPIDPAQFPISSPVWPLCTSGAQMAGLVRLEGLLNHGGIWLDSDVEIYRRLDPLLPLKAFAAWEDRRCVPDAVIGAEVGHPAIRACLDAAILRVEKRQGAWESGPGVTTAILPSRDDVLLLPPGAFFPYHYSRKKTDRDRDHATEQPWSFGAHHWHASWLPPEKR